MTLESISKYWILIMYRYSKSTKGQVTWFISDGSIEINQYSKLISIEHSGMNKVDWHFEDLEYLNTINTQHSEMLSNVTERG